LPGEGRRAERDSAHKLRRPAEIREIVKTGTALRSDRVVVYLARGSGPPRGAWVAGRRVGGAVHRNRARRILREAWGRVVPQVQDGWRAVLVARQPILTAGAADMVEEVGGLLGRAGALKE
jgi:ribonuclease P protein component